MWMTQEHASTYFNCGYLADTLQAGPCYIIMITINLRTYETTV